MNKKKAILDDRVKVLLYMEKRDKDLAQRMATHFGMALSCYFRQALREQLRKDIWRLHEHSERLPPSDFSRRHDGV